MRKKFEIENYKDIKNYENYEFGKMYCMHCNTESKAKVFLKHLDSIGRKWCSRDSYLEVNNYNVYCEDTVYYFNDGSYGSAEFAKGDKSTKSIILEFDDFDFNENSCRFMTKYKE